MSEELLTKKELEDFKKWIITNPKKNEKYKTYTQQYANEVLGKTLAETKLEPTENIEQIKPKKIAWKNGWVAISSDNVILEGRFKTKRDIVKHYGLTKLKKIARGEYEVKE